MNNEEFKKHCELQALWWIASATTGHAKSRQITKGDGTPLTDQEKTDNALNIAQNHIHLFRECCDEKHEPMSMSDAHH